MNDHQQPSYEREESTGVFVIGASGERIDFAGEDFRFQVRDDGVLVIEDNGWRARSEHRSNHYAYAPGVWSVVGHTIKTITVQPSNPNAGE